MATNNILSNFSLPVVPRTAVASAPTPEPYSRWDASTPGSYLAIKGITPAVGAANFDQLMGITAGQAAEKLNARIKEVGPFALVRGELNSDPAFQLYSGLSSPQSVRMREFFADQGVGANASEYDKAMAVDAYHRSIQLQNQMPKNARGFAGSVFGKILPIALGALTGNPALGALFGTVAGAATGGLKGAATGALSGFGAGGGFAPITDKIKDAAAGAFSRGGPVTQKIGNVLLDPFGSAKNALGSLVSSAASGPPGGTLTSINNLFPSDIAARALSGRSGGSLTSINHLFPSDIYERSLSGSQPLTSINHLFPKDIAERASSGAPGAAPGSLVRKGVSLLDDLSDLIPRSTAGDVEAQIPSTDVNTVRQAPSSASTLRPGEFLELADISQFLGKKSKIGDRSKPGAWLNVLDDLRSRGAFG